MRIRRWSWVTSVAMMGFLNVRDGATGTGRPGDGCAVAGCKPSMMVVFFPPQKGRGVAFPAAQRLVGVFHGEAARTMVPTLQRGNRSPDAPASRQTDAGASTACVPTLERWHDQKNQTGELTARITGWQWSAAELPVRVDAVVMCFLHLS